MSDILNIPPANSYLTSKQWRDVVGYVKNRKNIQENTIIEEAVEEEIIKEPRVMTFSTRSIGDIAEVSEPSGTPLSSSGGTLGSGEYYLNKDVVLSEQLTIASDVTIDLNGHVLKTSSGFIAIVNNSCSLTIKDSNPTLSHYGTVSNGIWKYNSSATTGVEIKGGIITGGTGDRGGAILLRGTLTMDGGTIAGCVAQEGTSDSGYDEEHIHYSTGGAGGAVFVDASSTYSGIFIMNGGSIKYCSSDPDINSHGGAVFIDSENTQGGTFIMNGGTIEYCSSYRGGAVYVHKSLSENSTAYAMFTMTGGTISNNTSRECGGAVYVTGRFIMDDGTIDGNETLKSGTEIDGVPSHTSYGGGVHLLGSSALFVMNGGVISNNYAASGGGVMAYTSSTFTMNGGMISGNFATGEGGTGNGGAVYVQASTFNFNNGILQDNWARRYGGGININQTATMNLNGQCRILNNSANHGGGISQESGDCRIELSNEDILISGNTARNNGNGGGLFIEKGVLNVSAGTIKENNASGRGGGLSMCVQRIAGDITVNMTGGNIVDNIAGTTGGGIDIFADYKDSSSKTNYVKVYLYGGVISGNNSVADGGGVQVWVNEANSKSLIYIGQDSSSIESVITNNHSGSNGGAISISSGDVVMNKGLLSLNSSENNGGSVYVAGGNFTMANGTLDDNTAEVSGGAVYITDGDVYIKSGTILSNIALDSGGAIAVTSGNVTIGIQECYDAGESSTHSHPLIEGNIASDGGGIYVDGGATTMWCGDIKHNHTYDKTVNVLVVSGGNFVYNGGTIGIPFDSGIFVNGGIFSDNTEDEQDAIKYELHYNSVLGDAKYNGGIPESKWIASPRGDILTIEDCDPSSLPWADLFPEYEFAGWESGEESEEVVTLNAIWEKR